MFAVVPINQPIDQTAAGGDEAGVFHIDLSYRNRAGRHNYYRFAERFAFDWRIHLMKTPAFLSKLPDLIIRPFVLLGRIVAKIWFAIFGRFSWSPPHWFSQSHAEWARFSQANPRITALIMAAIFLISCGAAWTWDWYQRRPKPHRVSASIEAIAVTKLEKELKYPPLIVRFSE